MRVSENGITAVGARDFYRANGVMKTFKHIVQEDLVASMRSVNVPCALVWGSEDRITRFG